MNSITKMVLISEDQYRRKCMDNKEDSLDIQPLLNANLPTDVKVKFINDLVLKRESKKPKPEAQPPLREDDENDGHQETESTVDDDDQFITPDTSTPKFQGDASTSRSELVDNMPASPVLKTRTRALELGLRSLVDLVDDKGLILREDGSRIRNSKVKHVVDYLRSFADMKLSPPGAARVIDYISKERPALLSLVSNPSALSKVAPARVKWRDLRRYSREFITTRRARED